MTAELFLTFVIVAVLGFLVGYSSGRSIGQEEGERAGLATAPVQLRETAYRRGLCPICGAEANLQARESAGREAGRQPLATAGE